MAISRALILFAACLVITACTEEKVEGSKTIYSFALWVPVMVAGLGLVIAFVGFKFNRAMVRKVSSLVIGGAFLILGVPGVMMDRVILDDQEFYLKTGIWFSPTIHQINWADVQTLRIVPRRKGADMVFVKKDGQSVEVPLSNLAEEALDKIMSIAKTHNIEVIDERK